MEEEIREITDPDAIKADPTRMMAAMTRSPAMGKLAALRVAASNFHFYREGGSFKGVHQALAESMVGPSERLDQVVEETIVALARLTVDIENCSCATCEREARREAAPYN